MSASVFPLIYEWNDKNQLSILYTLFLDAIFIQNMVNVLWIAQILHHRDEGARICKVEKL